MTNDSLDLPLDTDHIDDPPTPAPPRVWPALLLPFIAFALVIALQATLGAVQAGILLTRGVDQSELVSRVIDSFSSPGPFLLMLVGSQAVFGIVALLAAYLSPVPMRQRLRFNSIRSPFRVYGLTVVGSILPLAVAIAAVYLVATVFTPDPMFEKLFEKMTPLWGILFVVLIAVLPGFFEEMLFRGYVQGRLLERWSPVVAIGVATILFALAHVTPAGIAVAFPLGLWLGIIAWRTQSIGPSIACHAFVNGGLNAWRLVIKFGELSETAQLIGNVIFLLIGTVCFVLACQMLAKYLPPSESSDCAVDASI